MLGARFCCTMPVVVVVGGWVVSAWFVSIINFFFFFFFFWMMLGIFVSETVLERWVLVLCFVHLAFMYLCMYVCMYLCCIFSSFPPLRAAILESFACCDGYVRTYVN